MLLHLCFHDVPCGSTLVHSTYASAVGSVASLTKGNRLCLFSLVSLQLNTRALHAYMGESVLEI